jgi:hypothetical protein
MHCARTLSVRECGGRGGGAWGWFGRSCAAILGGSRFCKFLCVHNSWTLSVRETGEREREEAIVGGDRVVLSSAGHVFASSSVHFQCEKGKRQEALAGGGSEDRVLL